MAKKISVPRGTADILPTETPIWQDIESKARRILSHHNYKEIRTPLFEDTALFKRSLGQSSDVVNKQLLDLASEKKDGLSLRPEGTASVVRSYIENNMDRIESITKLYYLGPMFRGERPQKGRLRQFHQIGVEVIGPNTDHPFIDAEVIALNVNLLKVFGLKDFELKINSLGSIKDKENFSKKLRKLLKPKISSLCVDCQRRYDHNVFRILDCKNKTCHQIVVGLKIDNSHLSKESQSTFGEVKGALDNLGISYNISHDLVRGLDYYSGTVFEITGSSLGSQDALSAGGRYNYLVSQLGGSDVPAMGFALGIERVLLSLPKSLQVIAPSLTTCIIALDDNSFQRAFKILHLLRSENISSDMSYRISSMKSQMRLANKMEARTVIIIGSAECEKKVVTVKDMTTGNQEEISVSDDGCKDLVEHLIERYH